MKHGKRDANHAEIKQAYLEAGCSVVDLADVGQGVPDLIVGGYHQRLETPLTALVEVKTESGKLRPGQVDFIDNWRGVVFVVRNRKEALAVFGIEID